MASIQLDESLIFITLIVVFAIFLLQRYPKLLVTLFLIIILYFIYKRYFINPRDMLNYISKFIENFDACTMNNMGYCNPNEPVGLISGASATGIDNSSFLPDILRAGAVSKNANMDLLKKMTLENYKLDRKINIDGINGTELTMDTIIGEIAILLDYKFYYEKVIDFVLRINTDDIVQKDFLARKLKFKMTKIFFDAYNTLHNKYPIQTFDNLLLSQREFSDTIDILIFLGLNEINNYKLKNLQDEFKDLNSKLNEFIIEKVNTIDSNDYDITTSKLPSNFEPKPANHYDVVVI